MQSLTVIRTSSNRLQTKNLVTGATYAKTSRIVETYEVPFQSLKQLRRELRQLARDPNACVIRGQLRDDAPAVLRRRKSCFGDEPQAWVMLDIDDLQLPPSLAQTPYTAEHIDCALRLLPAEFQHVSCVWQASASAGVEPDKLKVHLWFLLDAPLTAQQLRVWFRHLDAVIVDKSTLRCVQPHYVANPIGGEKYYDGKRIGIRKGSYDRITTPSNIDEWKLEATADRFELTPRPTGCADVAKAQIKGAKRAAKQRSQELLDNLNVVYQDAYVLGTYWGPVVALQCWNDAANGHTPDVWYPLVDKLATKWGRVFAELPGAHDECVYINRVHEGVVWAMSAERERLAQRSERVVEEARERTREMQERLLGRLMRSSGSEKVLREVASELGRYAHVIGREQLLERLQMYSGLSEKQCEEAMAEGEATPVDVSAWREGLLIGRGELIEASDENIALIYSQHPEFSRGFEYNIRMHVLEVLEGNVLGLPVGPVDIESIDNALVLWLGSLGMRKVSRAAAFNAFKSFVSSSVTKYDPFLRLYPEALLSRKEAKRQLALFRKPRLDQWLRRYMGVVGAPDAYVEAVGARALIGTVARAVDPGCEVHTMLVLMGEQGTGKTAAVKMLAGVIDDGYKELLDMRDRDSLLIMQSSLLVEVSELRALRGTQEEHAKAFMTRPADHIRAPYARKAEMFPRRMVFIGTTNDDDFLTDTDNRRYWPVECSGDSTLTPVVADKLWREAALRYAAGEVWWLDTRELQEYQRAETIRVRETCEIETTLRKQLKRVSETTIHEAIRLVYPDIREAQKYFRRTARALKILGFTRKHTSKGKKWVRNDS